MATATTDLAAAMTTLARVVSARAKLEVPTHSDYCLLKSTRKDCAQYRYSMEIESFGVTLNRLALVEDAAGDCGEIVQYDVEECVVLEWVELESFLGALAAYCTDEGGVFENG